MKAFKDFMTKSEIVYVVDLDLFRKRLIIFAAHNPMNYDDALAEITLIKIDQTCDGADAKQIQMIIGGDVNAMIGRTRSDETYCIVP